jgi:hypothetical protein
VFWCGERGVCIFGNDSASALLEEDAVLLLNEGGILVLTSGDRSTFRPIFIEDGEILDGPDTILGFFLELVDAVSS